MVDMHDDPGDGSAPQAGLVHGGRVQAAQGRRGRCARLRRQHRRAADRRDAVRRPHQGHPPRVRWRRSCRARAVEVMLCDAGANTECTAEMLLQFAFLASLYAEKNNGLSSSRASVWSTTARRTPRATRCARRPTRCCKRPQATQGRLNFVGNVEGSHGAARCVRRRGLRRLHGQRAAQDGRGRGEVHGARDQGACSRPRPAPSSAICCAKRAWTTSARCSIRTRSAARPSSASQSRSSRRTARPTRSR